MEEWDAYIKQARDKDKAIAKKALRALKWKLARKLGWVLLLGGFKLAIVLFAYIAAMHIADPSISKAVQWMIILIITR